ncbi:aminomethyltransferase family protein [Neptuniibacter marinus]|uniref:hypothetical protein n=1 Tax=Neptuniibacter marinus TaxID=1806670 RepID=UPI000834AC56|nr:hypothetical protein [Neptuniibacter marinus]
MEEITKNIVKPETYLARSPLYRVHEAAGAHFEACASAAQVASYGDQSEPLAALIDLSVQHRFGIRGANAIAALSAAGLSVPEKPNQCLNSANGETVLRLGKTEFWVLGAMESGTCSADSSAFADCYPVYCQDSHACLLLSGEQLPDIMAKLCGVDLSESVFPKGSIAQTSVARINAIISHLPDKEGTHFVILCDSAAAEYLWACLLDAMDEFGGKAAGLNYLF